MPVVLTEEAIDDILARMQDSVTKVDECQGKLVKLRNAETELLKAFEVARDYMMEMLKSQDPGREKLQNIFGGDCSRIARIRVCLDNANLSDQNMKDNRHEDCSNACKSVEDVLNDLGCGEALRKALEEQKAKLKTRRSRTFDQSTIDAAMAETAAEEAAQAVVVEEPPEPPPPEPEKKPSKKDIGSEALDRTMDESLIERILACTSAAELAELPQPDKSESLGNWMIWMVHRAHLDDPTLEKFDFTNLQMPKADDEPRISPKLAKAISTNTHITHLLLANTNLQITEGGVLAESIASNGSIRVLNIDSNFLGESQMESLANACGTNQTIEELRVNNQHGLLPGRAVFEAFANAVKANKMICKLGLNITEAHFRNEIDRQIMRNNDDARKRRVAAKKAAEAAAGGYPES